MGKPQTACFYTSPMKFYVNEAQLQPLEDALAVAVGPQRGALLIELAWHLRQRDSRRATALLAEAPSDTARSALIACEIATLFCRLDAAEAQLLRARSVLAAEPDSEGKNEAEGDAHLAEAMLAKVQVQHGREQRAYQRAIEAFSGAADDQRLSIAQAWQCYEQTFIHAGAALALERPSDTAALAWWMGALALTQSRREPAKAAEFFLQASELAQASGQLRLTVVCAINAGSTLQGLGDFDEASSCFANAVTLANRSAWPTLIGAAQVSVGRLLRELGQLRESHAVLSAAQRSLGAAPAGHSAANASGELAQTLLALGQAVEAVEPIAEAMRIYRSSGATTSMALNLISQARILAAAGQAEAALAALGESEALIAKHGYHALGVAVNDALAEVHRRHVLTPPPLMTAPNAAIHYAEAALRSGQLIQGWQAPAVLFIALADDWEAAGDIPRAYDYARKALAAKAREAALTLDHPLAVLRLRLQQAHDEDEDEHADGEQRPPVSDKLLTPKEREILALLARNYSNKEIANALTVSSETVKWHLKALYSKLEAASRKHAVTRARTMGMLGRG